LYEIHETIAAAREISGLNVPSDSVVISSKRDWRTFEGGQTLLELEVPDDFAKSIMESCSTFGYRPGPLSAAGISVPAVDQLLPASEAYCFRIADRGGGFDLAIVSRKRLLVYVAG
jgi:hypothetical protein